MRASRSCVGSGPDGVPAKPDRAGRCDPRTPGAPGCFRRKRALVVSAPLICLLTSQGNAFVAASHSLAYESSKGPLMSGRAEPPVRSIGADPVAFTEFYRAHVDEVTRFVARRIADPQLAADRKSTRLNSSHPSTSYAVFCLK